MQVKYRARGDKTTLSYQEFNRRLASAKSSEDVLRDKICNIDSLENLFIAICIELTAWAIVKMITG